MTNVGGTCKALTDLNVNVMAANVSLLHSVLRILLETDLVFVDLVDPATPDYRCCYGTAPPTPSREIYLSSRLLSLVAL